MSQKIGFCFESAPNIQGYFIKKKSFLFFKYLKPFQTKTLKITFPYKSDIFPYKMYVEIENFSLWNLTEFSFNVSV